MELNCEIDEDDRYAFTVLSLAMSIINTIRSKPSNREIHQYTRDVVISLCEPMLDSLFEAYDWSKSETEYAEGLLKKQVTIATVEVLEIANRRITHRNKRERQTKLCVEDMKLAVMVAYLLNVPNQAEQGIKAEFIENHGDMYFQ